MPFIFSRFAPKKSTSQKLLELVWSDDFSVFIYSRDGEIRVSLAKTGSKVRAFFIYFGASAVGGFSPWAVSGHNFYF